MPLTAKTDAEEKAKLKNKTIAATGNADAKCPLLGYSDGYHIHFLGSDADTVATITGKSVDKHDGVNHVAIDTRVWNDINDKLNAEKHSVSITDVPE